jgi:hypothetical protein
LVSDAALSCCPRPIDLSRRDKRYSAAAASSAPSVLAITDTGVLAMSALHHPRDDDSRAARNRDWDLVAHIHHAGIDDVRWSASTGEGRRFRPFARRDRSGEVDLSRLLSTALGQVTVASQGKRVSCGTLVTDQGSQ